MSSILLGNRPYKTICLILLTALILMTGCSNAPPTSTGPVLIEDTVLEPSATPFVQPPSPTATVLLQPTPTIAITLPTRDSVAETAVALVTPTLAPSRTPTATPTITYTPSMTFTATHTRAPTLTPSLTVTPSTFQTAAPLSGLGGGLPGAVNPDGSCATNWFFSPAPTGCAVRAASSSTAAFQPFEGGRMIWVGSEQAIYVLYGDGQYPGWERYPDTYREGMPERDVSIVGPLGLWQQPRRGFGLVWRTYPQVRQRLGWALEEWETGYTANIQQAGIDSGGAVYISGVNGQILLLPGDGGRWTQIGG